MSEKENILIKQLIKALEKDDSKLAFNLTEQIKEEEIKNRYPSLRRFDFNKTTTRSNFPTYEMIDYFEVAKECIKDE